LCSGEQDATAAASKDMLRPPCVGAGAGAGVGGDSNGSINRRRRPLVFAE